MSIRDGDRLPRRRILTGSDLMIVGDRMPGKRYNGFIKSGFVERFPELSLFYRLFSPLNSEMICIFPYFCPYAESAREIRGIFVALHINNWFSEPILI